MAYKRHATRPMRVIEQNLVTQERDRLQARCDQLKAENMCLRRDLTLKQHEAEQLFHHKVSLVNQLRSATATINFLEGRETNDGFRMGPGTHYGFKRWLPGWFEG